jgi:hypothetical protein
LPVSGISTWTPLEAISDADGEHHERHDRARRRDRRQADAAHAAIIRRRDAAVNAARAARRYSESQCCASEAVAGELLRGRSRSCFF